MFSRFLTIILSLTLTVLPSQAAGQETRSATRAIDTTQAPTPPQPAPAPEAFTDTELQQLAQREQNPGPEVTGGALSNLHLTYIVIALAAAVIVLIAK